MSRDDLKAKIKVRIDEIARQVRILRGEVKTLINLYDNDEETNADR